MVSRSSVECWRSAVTAPATTFWVSGRAAAPGPGGGARSLCAQDPGGQEHRGGGAPGSSGSFVHLVNLFFPHAPSRASRVPRLPHAAAPEQQRAFPGI